MKALEVKNILKEVEDWRWISYFLTNTISVCCGIGHLYRLSTDKDNYGFSLEDVKNNKEASKFIFYDVVNFMYKFHKEDIENLKNKTTYKVESVFAYINNGESIIYVQKTPKERIIALLDDMTHKGY